MHELTIQNTIFKAKLLQCQREYWSKKRIEVPSPDDILRMRRAVASRLKKEMAVLAELHATTVQQLYSSESEPVGFFI